MFTIAAAFGNVHGVYKAGNVQLRPEILGNAQAYAKEQLKVMHASVVNHATIHSTKYASAWTERDHGAGDHQSEEYTCNLGFMVEHFKENLIISCLLRCISSDNKNAKENICLAYLENLSLISMFFLLYAFMQAYPQCSAVDL
jgi:fructose/tagatose bisphosphate aldolase